MLKSLGFGLSQVIGQRSLGAAVCFALGLLISPIASLGALLGVVASTIAGRIFSAKTKENCQAVEDGMYGYNGVLVGIAVYFYLGATWQSTAALLSGAILSAAIQRLMLANGFPSFTAPFVIATWAVLGVAQSLGAVIAPHQISYEPLPEVWYIAPLAGVGQIMFQGATSGILFVLGTAAGCGKRSAWLVAGAAVGSIIGLALGQSLAALNAGLFGFNSALTVFALMTTTGVRLKIRAVTALIGAFAAVLLTICFNWAGVPALTAPFVLATWLSLGFSRRSKRFEP